MDPSTMTMEEELGILRQQNAALKSVVRRGLKQRLGLKDLPPDLQDDREWVFAAISARSTSWYDLSQEWKDDVEIARAFFEMDCMDTHEGESGLRWKDLPYHLKMDEDLLLHALRTTKGPSWDDTPRHFQGNPEVVATAVVYRKMYLHDVPDDLLQTDPQIALIGVKNYQCQAEDCPCLTPDILRQAIEDGDLGWESLPIALQTDLDFALSVSRFPGGEVPESMLLNVSELRDHPEFWLKLVHSEELGESFKVLYLKNFAPPHLRADRDFMISMCRECMDIFPLVEESVANDPAFLEEILEQNPTVLGHLSEEIQQRHRDLVVKAVAALGQRKDNQAFLVSRAIYPPFWMSNSFAMTWVKAGLGFPTVLSQGESNAWSKNRGLCLAQAKHGSAFAYDVPLKFRMDASFMLEAVEHKPELYSYAVGAAKTDPAVKTMAYAALPEIAAEEMVDLHLKGHDDEIQQYLDFLRNKLDPFNAFWECILGNMLSTQSVEGTGTNLTLLNQGPDTSRAYKKRLAEYLDLPTGKWLCRLQQAERNVLKAIAPWTSKGQPSAYPAHVPTQPDD